MNFEAMEFDTHEKRNSAERQLKTELIKHLEQEFAKILRTIETGKHAEGSKEHFEATTKEISDAYFGAVQILSDIDKAEAFLKSWAAPTPENLPLVTGEDPPPPDCILEHWLPRGELTILSGAGGLGKSHLALQLACALACGCPEHFLDDQHRQADGDPLSAKSLFATWEDSYNSTRRRIQRILATMAGWLDINRVKKNVLYRDMKPQGHIWIPATSSGHIATRGHMGNPGHNLLDDCVNMGIDFLVLDSIVAIFGQDSNSAPHVRQFLNYLSAWCNDTGITALMLGHPSKADQKGILGSVDWTNGVRSVWTLTEEDLAKEKGEDSTKSNNKKPEKLYYSLNHYKANDAPKQPSVPLGRQPNGMWVQLPSPDKAVQAYQAYKSHWAKETERQKYWAEQQTQQEDTNANENPYIFG